MYDVFIRTLKTSMGQNFVCTHEATGDAQAVQRDYSSYEDLYKVQYGVGGSTFSHYVSKDYNLIQRARHQVHHRLVGLNPAL